METKLDNWQLFYKKSAQRKHSKRASLALKLNESGVNVVVDCGCGVGNDLDFFEQHSYRCYGFDINREAVSFCQSRFDSNSLVEISQASFDSYDYPSSGIVLANSSLFFAKPESFNTTWDLITSSLELGGVFAGDFMGVNDSWCSNYRSPITAMTKEQVLHLFDDFDIIHFSERDELGKTALGATKHWHIFSVVAVKRA